VSREYTREIKLGAEQAGVWAALTDAEELSRWLVEVAHVEPKIGGAYSLNFGDGVELPSRIEAWEPGRRLRLSGPGPIIQEYTLESDGDATTLRVLTSVYPTVPTGTVSSRVVAAVGRSRYAACSTISSITAGRRATSLDYVSTHAFRSSKAGSEQPGLQASLASWPIRPL